MKKSRLTITISPTVLTNIDRLIDGRTIRNRSHAIEYLVNQQLLGQVSQCLILAGGRKKAVEDAVSLVAGKPLITHLINLVKSYGIHRISILTDQATEILEKAIGQEPDVTIKQQPPNLGTAGALLHMRAELLPQPMLVLHADMFTDINISDLIRFHQTQGTLATICVKPKLNQQEFGKAVLHGNLVTSFAEKPSHSEVGMVNTGIYLINPEALNTLTPKSHLMLETDLFPQLAKTHQLSGFLFEGLWHDTTKKN